MKDSKEKKEKKAKKTGKIVMCSKPGCLAASEEFRAALKKEIKQQGLKGIVRIKEKSCIGQCSKQPAAYLKRDDKLFTNLDKKDIPKLLEAAKKGLPL